MNDNPLNDQTSATSYTKFSQGEQGSTAEISLENRKTTSLPSQQPTQKEVAYPSADFIYSNFLTSSPSFLNPTHRLSLFLYLIPIIGFFPSLWTLYHCQGSREQMTVSRLSITLAGTWLLGYLLMGFGAEASEFLALRLLILNSFFTSSYFLVSIWLMFLIVKGKSVRLPGFSQWARILSKHLS